MTDNHRCEICFSRQANRVIIRRRLDDYYRTFVCSECAKERARLYTGTAFGLMSVLHHVEQAGKKPTPAYSCASCGTTIAEIIADGRPGCCACYVRFDVEIGSAIEHVQKRTRHSGKAPGR
ncbi:MAG: hypothetical protein GX141_10730 [Armatimonadetes bacterium]|nr:hypothetical protein [Armatimonadota bacterium]